MAGPELSVSYSMQPGTSQQAPLSLMGSLSILWQGENLLLPLLNLRVAKGGKARQAILFMIVNHVLRDLFDGWKCSWKERRKESVWATESRPKEQTLATQACVPHPLGAKFRSGMFICFCQQVKGQGRLIHKLVGEKSRRETQVGTPAIPNSSGNAMNLK